jgi:large subunit ribosomal protein L17
VPTVPGRPKKGPRFGGDAEHQKAMMGNLVASLIAAEAIVTTEAKAKALRPVVEKCITKAKRAYLDADDNPARGVHLQREVVGFIRDKEMARKLFAEIGPRYADRAGGYTRILKLGPRHGDNAPMARIEFV